MGMDVVKVLTAQRFPALDPCPPHPSVSAPVAVFHRKDRRLTNRPQNDSANQILKF